jgi:hypothetical protein
MMPTNKDVVTEKVRARLLGSPSKPIETHAADCAMTTLSFQSLTYSERHVWIDTDLGGESKVDLEDWNCDDTWDNSVAHVFSQNLELLSSIVELWLNGGSISDCKRLGGEDVEWRDSSG